MCPGSDGGGGRGSSTPCRRCRHVHQDGVVAVGEGGEGRHHLRQPRSSGSGPVIHDVGLLDEPGKPFVNLDRAGTAVAVAAEPLPSSVERCRANAQPDADSPAEVVAVGAGGIRRKDFRRGACHRLFIGPVPDASRPDLAGTGRHLSGAQSSTSHVAVSHAPPGVNDRMSSSTHADPFQTLTCPAVINLCRSPRR